MNKQSFKFVLTIVLISFLSTQLFAVSLDLLHDKKFDVSEGELLELEISTGDIIIDSWNENSVSVKIFGNSKAVDKMEFTLEKTDKGIFVKAKKKGSSWFSWFSSIKLRCEIKVPAEFNIESRTSGGDVKIINVEGEIAAKTSGGDISLNDNIGNLLAKTSGGDVVLKNHFGYAELKTSGGDIEVIDAEGNLDANTSGGDIKVKASNGKIYAGTSGGDVMVYYNGANEGIKLRSSGGSILVKLPENFSADVYLSTSGGDVEVNYPAQSSSKIKSGKYEGTFNGGGNELDCRTSGGDITVRSL
ncbi:MAG: DUF4097 family beta strand repeat protein [Ignavibacteriae bacterium]|nr:hypothetical protein [Ignavibacteriota bacterium]NOG99624.1 DUF4097 family beta strand repeat protein [Ignavibacteriota bacterium]